MDCPSCQSGQLTPNFIDDQFRAHQCTNCEGHWILVEDYIAWKESHPDYEFDNSADGQRLEAEESKQAMLCPQTGALMQKYKISAETPHRLDYSPHVGGIWLDKGEWELLKKEGLAGSLNAVVTHHWQNQIRQDSAKAAFEALYQDKFGEEAYQKVKEIREWLHNQPNKADLRAYLLAVDPYSAER